MRRPALALLAAGLLLCACAPDGGNVHETMPQSTTNEFNRPASLALACSGCHVAGGEAIRSLDAYTPVVIQAALDRYKLETSGTTVMHRLMRGYSDADIAEVSEYLGQKAAQE